MARPRGIGRRPLRSRRSLSEASGARGGPQSTFYAVQRLLPHDWHRSALGTTTSKRFTDETLPVDPGQVQYSVNARHGKHTEYGSIVLVRLGMLDERKTPGKDAA